MNDERHHAFQDMWDGKPPEGSSGDADTAAAISRAIGMLGSFAEEAAFPHVIETAVTDAREALARLVSRLQEAERERDEARANAIMQAAATAQTMWREQKTRAEAAEARLEAAREALRAIAETPTKEQIGGPETVHDGVAWREATYHRRRSAFDVAEEMRKAARAALVDPDQPDSGAEDGDGGAVTVEDDAASGLKEGAE